jgi:hypothetical protein
MNHLRELLDSAATGWNVPVSMAGADADAVAAEVRRIGPHAISFWLGEVEDTEGLSVIPELCKLPYDVCWFEIGCTTPAKSWIMGMLAIKTTAATRLTLFRRMHGVWELVCVSDLEQFNSGQMFTLPAEERAAEKAKAVRLKIAAFLSALHCSNVRREEHAPSEKLQKARAKRGKAPLFSYWTLQLDGKRERGDSHGGTHASLKTCQSTTGFRGPKMAEVVLQDPALDIADPHTRLLVLAEYWKDKCSEARIERDELRYRCYLYLDAFDEHDICDAFAGLPVEYFNPGPDFGA